MNRDSLHVVANLLGDDGLDSFDVGVFEAELVAEVRVDLYYVSTTVRIACSKIFLTIPMRMPSTATTFWMVAFRFAWLRQFPQDW